MADKAAARAAEQDRIWRKESAIEWAKTEEEYIQERADELTVEKAQYLRDNPFMGACACIGGKSCCRITSQAIERVLGQ